MTAIQFRRLVFSFYRKHGRHDLPWRKTHDPYRILVSEIMLQQTQVERVIPFYKNFLAKFPTPKRLASAPLSDALRAWQGLGYNRRAKNLHAAAKFLSSPSSPICICSGRYKSKYLRSGKSEGGEGGKGGKGDEGSVAAELEKLPGVGPYTARAVAAFAFDEEGVFIETNIRTAVMHHFFQKKKKVSDAQIEKILEKAFPKGKSREWYAALMDYGAYLKRSGVRLNAKSAHHAKQSRFAGSNREARGAILKELSRGPRSGPRLMGLLGDDRRAQMKQALAALLFEQLIQKRGREKFSLPR